MMPRQWQGLSGSAMKVRIGCTAGSYVVLRRIRIALEHWDRMPLEFQEQSVGRHKNSGAPLGRDHEFDPADLTATGKDGDLLIPESAHIRLAAAASNKGAQILRRPYSYNDGIDFTIERWPPWRRGVEYDAGLLFVCYQRDLRAGFIKIFDKLAKFDMLNQFVTHTGRVLGYRHRRHDLRSAGWRSYAAAAHQPRPSRAPVLASAGSAEDCRARRPAHGSWCSDRRGCGQGPGPYLFLRAPALC